MKTNANRWKLMIIHNHPWTCTIDCSSVININWLIGIDCHRLSLIIIDYRFHRLVSPCYKSGGDARRQGVNFGLWFHLGCSGQSVILFSHEGHIEGCTLRSTKTHLHCASLLRLIYGVISAHSCTCALKTWLICLDSELCQLKNGFSSTTSTGTPFFFHSL